MKTTLTASAALIVIGCAACSSSTTGTAPRTPAASTRHAITATATATATHAARGSDALSWCNQLASYDSVVLNRSSAPTQADLKHAEQLADSAPGAIRADAKTVVAADERLAAGQGNQIETPKFEQAGARLVQWLKQNCPAAFRKLNPGQP